MTNEHAHKFERYHADYCHRYEWGYICECGKKRHVDSQARDFSYPDSAWWHWGRAGCGECQALMQRAGLDPAALGDETLACVEIDRQFARLSQEAM